MTNTIENIADVGAGAPTIKEPHWRNASVAESPRTPSQDLWSAQEGVSRSAREDRVEIKGLYGVLRAGKDVGNRVAADIRGLGQVGDLMSQVHVALAGIVKSFPPFPPGSDERERFLESVAGIRAMIDRLSFPAVQHRAVSEVLGAPAFTDGAASDQALNAGLEQVGRLAIDLKTARAALGESANIGLPDGTEEPIYVGQSQSVGKALLEGNLSIGGKSRYSQEIFN